MAFTVADFDDLMRLLTERPEWRVELRHALLSDDFEALPGIVRDLAEAQRGLAESHRRSEERLGRLEETVAQLVEAVAQLVEAQRRSEERIGRLEETQRQIENRLADLDGRTLQASYRDNAPSYFGCWLRRVKVMTIDDVMDLGEDRLSDQEWDDVRVTDVLVRGRVRQRPDRPEVWLAVEVSSVIDRNDVERAVRRAELLRRVGLQALPVVAGKRTTVGADVEALARGVAVLRDGAGELWAEALAVWLGLSLSQ